MHASHKTGAYTFSFFEIGGRTNECCDKDKSDLTSTK